MLKIRVTAPPEKGRANADLAALISQTLGLRPKDVSLISGELSRTKKFRLEISSAELRSRLADLGDSGVPPP